MDRGEVGSPAKRRRRRCVLLSCVCLLLVAVVVAVVLGVTLSRREKSFQHIFIDRCQKFSGYDCQKVWSAFEQAYVGRDPCQVPMEAYDPFIAATPFNPACSNMMFWSKTKDLVHDFTEKTDCFVTLEDTLLGSVVDGLTWCGKQGSDETFTTDCPGWTDCVNNTVRSFWNRASAAFAEHACGNVTSMLNGSIATPFSADSIFASIEVKRFSAAKVKNVNVVLVTQQNSMSNCTNASLKDLQTSLAPGIKYFCQEVTETQIRECGSKLSNTCGPCW
ncbi:uncharacterized protein V6R79_025865 [Siganus canaliculatus]